MEASLEAFAEALALGEGFQLGLLIVPDQARADQAVGALQRLVSEKLGRPAHLTRIAPSADLADPEALVTATLDPLATLGPSDGVVLDASTATAREEPAWAELFRRLNTRRNGIARQIGRALILCLTPRLEQVCAHEAPDLWSVRGPRAELRPALGVVRSRRDGLRFEDAIELGLMDELAGLYPEISHQRQLLSHLGYPPAQIPSSRLFPVRFWRDVLRRLDQGVTPGGIEALVRLVAMDYPGNPAIQRALTRLSDPGATLP